MLSPAVLPGAFVLDSRYSETINRPTELMCKTRRKLKNVQSDVIKESWASLCPKPDTYFNLCLLHFLEFQSEFGNKEFMI